MRIRTIKPEFWHAEAINPVDRAAWKVFGESGPGREFLYLLSDSAGRLVYVGITWNPFVRWTSHSRKQAWWSKVAYATVWRCSDADARPLETLCIKTLAPMHNVHQVVR